VPLEEFSPAVSHWFRETFAAPTEPQAKAWPLIRQGNHVLVSAPTGSGKTLAAFMVAIDRLGRTDRSKRTETGGARVLYVSPLRSLATDIAVNLVEPLAGIASIDASFGGIAVGVRTGDTSPTERARQTRRPPEIVATTPESLALMLLSEGGRKILGSIECVIVDELHAVVGSKRGPHLALSLELLEDLVSSTPDGGLEKTGDMRGAALQRIGLSATQEPIEEMARYLGGVGREVSIVDTGGFRDLALHIEVPGSEATAVCSAERWAEIYRRVADLIRDHRSTLVFVSTRKLAERVGAHLQDLLGSSSVASHHGSLSKERRHDVEARLKSGELAAVVATASLELGIDIGEVDLVIQIGSPKSVTTLMQRVGRSGHALWKVPKGIIFPLTQDELQEACAIVQMIEERRLDKALFVENPMDVLAQQIVVACVVARRNEDALFELVRRAWPYRHLARQEFDAVVALHSNRRSALLHRDPVTHMVGSTKKARLFCLTNSGTIPDTGEYEVVHSDDGTHLGSLDEDFAIESSIGDVFQLGNSAWRVVKVRQGQVLVTEAPQQPASFPFWFGEAPSRTIEVGRRIGSIRQSWLDRYREGMRQDRRIEWLRDTCSIGKDVANFLDRHFSGTVDLLGTLPTHKRVVAERFFDRSGGMQMVIHSPFGSRLNRAWGLALRKKFCRSFGFELQAAAGDDALLISLSTMHSFPLEDVFEFLSPESVRHVLEQAVLGTPLFATRWRWALGCALLVERNRAGKKVPINLQRTIAEDRLAEAFPQSLACFETLPPGDLPIPKDHPIVSQAIRDCIEDLMDVEGLSELLVNLENGRIERLAVDVPEPSPMAEGILSAQPYAFLDDAPLEERRTHGVPPRLRMSLGPYSGSVDPDIAEAVRKSRWPKPTGVEETHQFLAWMGFVSDDEAAPQGWMPYLEELARSGRVERDGGVWRARGIDLDENETADGRLQALGIVFGGEEWRLGGGGERALLELEIAGKAMRIKVGESWCWAERSAAATAYKLMRQRLKDSFSPVDEEVFEEFTRCWQHVGESNRLDGPEGVFEAVLSTGGLPIEAGALERDYLAARVRGYRPEWLDTWIASGRLVWFRAGNPSRIPMSKLALCICAFEEAHLWMAAWQRRVSSPQISGNASAVYDLLLERGPRLVADLERDAGIPSAWIEDALCELVSAGLVTADSFGLMRWLMRPNRLRSRPLRVPGRVWALQRELASSSPSEEEVAECVARGLLVRAGIVWREAALEARLPIPWGELRRALRRLEERGEARWGRFVKSGSGEQFAHPDAPDYLASVAARRTTAQSG
jgi:ATP-dependent Lhr-like helicase